MLKREKYYVGAQKKKLMLCRKRKKTRKAVTVLELKGNVQKRRVQRKQKKLMITKIEVKAFKRETNM